MKHLGPICATLLLWATAVHAQTPCTHYASPLGAGTACTQQAPCKVQSWWALAGPGKALCLTDGTYQGGDSMIQPPPGIAGTQSAPITIRALNDGKVLLDAQHSTFAMYVPAGNDWYVVEGFNARHGTEFTYQFAGSHNRGRRLIAWEGTSGQPDSHMFKTGRQVDNVYEDVAAWGKDSRKIFDGAQSQAADANSQWSGYRRAWGEFSDWPQGGSNPTNTYQIGYRTRQQRHENVLGTWNLTPGGQPGSPDGVVALFYDCEAPSISMHGAAVLGSIFYALPGTNFTPGSVTSAFCVSDVSWKDVVAYVGPGFPAVKPFYWRNQTSSDTPKNNVCDNCVSVHNGSPSQNDNRTGWTLPHFREGNGLAAATGGQSIFTLLPGLCKRYVEGQLTTQPLWPWPMNQRIKEARVASGYAEVDVTATIEQMFGPIPPECTSGGVAPEPPPSTSTGVKCTGTLGPSVAGVFPLTIDCTSK